MTEPLNWRQIKEMITSFTSTVQIPIESYAEENGWADSFILDLKRNNAEIKATQLRRFFHRVKQIQSRIETTDTFDRSEIAGLMPMLAYARGRKLIPEDFYDLMKLCFGSERCKTKEDFLASASFLEAVMAYHKYHAGQKEE